MFRGLGKDIKKDYKAIVEYINQLCIHRNAQKAANEAFQAEVEAAEKLKKIPNWREIEDRQMNKEMQEKIANWKAANSIDGFCSILGLTLEEMVEAAEMWRERRINLFNKTHGGEKTKPVEEPRRPDKGQVVWEDKKHNKFNFDNIKDWYEWIKNYYSFSAGGRLTVGDFKDDKECDCKQWGQGLDGGPAFDCKGLKRICKLRKWQGYMWSEKDQRWIDKETIYAAERLAAGYKVGDQLKIKMPPDWDFKEKLDTLRNAVDATRLTRQEAINKLMAAENTFDPGYASRQIDVFVNLGMLKLKEEKEKKVEKITMIQ